MALDLPAEVLSQIFTLAADEDLIFQYALPTSLASSSWFEHDRGGWALRTPQEAGTSLMDRSYKTKMALMLTCRQWYGVAQEHLFRCLYFKAPARLIKLANSLGDRRDATTGEGTPLGWWTRRLHVYRRPTQALDDSALKAIHNALLRIIKHCPNLEIFHVEWPLREAFGEIALALSENCKRSLRTVHFNVPRNALSKVIWALDPLKFIVAAHIEFEQSRPSNDPNDDEDNLNLGSAFDYQLNLQYLYQLSIVGHAREFLEQASEWFLPSLKIFSYDTGLYTGEVTEAILGFLKIHGDTLEFLDLDIHLPLKIATILDMCPQVSTFAFNADWRVTPVNNGESELVHRPRANITTIGLHGLQYAFGVGNLITTKNESTVGFTQKTNDHIMAALNKRNFPNLQRVRALSRPMLLQLNEAGQPNEAYGGMARWTRWWDTCASAQIRLEDCTGDSLGNLPSLGDGDEDDEDEESDEYEDVSDDEEYDDDDDDEDDDDDDDDEDDDEDESSDSDDEHILPSGWKKLIPPMPKEQPSARTRELRELLKECKAMERERIRETSLLPPSFMMMMAGGGGFPGPEMMPGFSGSDIPTAVGGMGFGFGASR